MFENRTRYGGVQTITSNSAKQVFQHIKKLTKSQVRTVKHFCNACYRMDKNSSNILEHQQHVCKKVTKYLL